MTYEEELKLIKKEYGEKVMQGCRDCSELKTAFDTPGTVIGLLRKNFAQNSRSLNKDFEQKNGNMKLVLDILVSEYEESVKKEIVEEEEEERSPFEIFKSEGYTLRVCLTEGDVKSYKKYYKVNEQLCTFGDIKDRLETHIIFWAVRDDVGEIKREDFTKPEREDKYGISVMSLQFSRETGSLSIKNRYNHTIKKSNPDATYGNNLDRISKGLGKSFEKALLERGVKFNSKLVEKRRLFGWAKAIDGKMYKYNFERDGNYYCPGNIIIEQGKPKTVGDKSKVLLIDGYLVNLEQKTIESIDGSDKFINEFKDIKKIEISVNKESKTKQIKFILENKEHPIFWEVDDNSRIIGYRDEDAKTIEDDFLRYSYQIKNIDMPNLDTIKKYFNPRMVKINTKSKNKFLIENGFIVDLENKIITCDIENLKYSLLDNKDLKNITDIKIINTEREKK